MIDKTQTAQEFIPLQYQVVCEYCRKTIFFSGMDKRETIYALCEKCSQFMDEPNVSES